jgi:hypothetical protein
MRGLIALPFLLAACGSPFGDCSSDRVEVTLPATIERNGVPESVALGDAVATGNVGAPEFETLRAVLTGDVASEDAGVVWTVSITGTSDGWISLAVDAPLSAGQTLDVGTTFTGAGWGLYDVPAGTKIAASVRDGAFIATSVTGTVQVLAVTPLRLRLDLTAADGSGLTVRIRGDASFAFVREPTPCT